MSHFSVLSTLPPDTLLGLMTAFRADPRPDKFDLGVGVYKDLAGETPILSAVKKAEARLIDAQTTKVYEGPRGNTDFCAHIEDFVFGKAHPARAEGRTTSFTVPGGCGALYSGISLMKRTGTKRVWVSKPTWPNHPNVVKSLGLEVKDYAYARDGEFYRLGMMADLSEAQPGDGVIIQGPCHNPTGIDPTLEDWKELGKLAKEKGLLVLLDVAYHGFAQSLDRDMDGVRAFMDEAGEAMIAYSCSKNLGLYRERTGCFLVLGETKDGIDAVTTHIADNGRATWSMPPAHGAGIVATVLGDAQLRAEWETELNAMRTRMKGLREDLSDALVKATGSNALAALKSQNGMFSRLPVTAAQTVELREKHGVYMPASGRINIAGLNPKDIPALSKILAGYL
ncbi:MAG: aspartate/tyrosine/aromatic aminotransferase [Hyphomonas sp.]|uniref:amino acid aminotransferase n=1 Tax=Hyphomonas sp. TaxID=87 RepID=UPI0017E013D5|nr:amino acid aminotransferase [Hyphomonas sp.]MBA3069516.1 aspartate/tyrosine/aromatic aminotransferase [Hyphomonas sp.]MBU3921788.1 aromatic amino acid transaminase [Alphaproteobacteria bacterium]MBU4063323.1 aromatic amino acid transaminase [Alphaproteobacteria bacterium]MBU4164141.1 aromatic amino acid transaminase [Alphaproteobacteria bacterium]